MKAIAHQLEIFIEQHITTLQKLPEGKLFFKTSPAKWSKKEIIGHLIDSAQSNISRFVVSQYEDNPTIVYNQDKWVAINNYQQWDTKDIIQLWYFLNRQMTFILKNISTEMSQRICQSEASHTIEWLAKDYIKHLKHHIHQILNLEPVAYP